MSPPDVGTPGPIAAAPGAGDHETQQAHSALAADAARKREATLQARAAMHAIELRRLANGAWLATRWNLQRELADDEIEPWLARVGGKPA